ncbi:hypothetical protein SOASR015_37110 [Pectobacterium carotovorum subsp. carotovorum]|nr:hypothetical protein SOASR015_37110 [Pectobacterium carotovorum subsp. carotovorum]GLX58473.1 hypothetical protein Pcaca02_37820 [Pectobacterium carotovorum subsp. carotovorum]
MLERLGLCPLYVGKIRSYRREKGSKVYFNPKSMNVVILKEDGNFLSGWKINPDVDNGRIYLKTGDL